MATTSDSKKRLALAIIDFLSSSLKDGTLTSDDSESIEVAQSCIADAFKVDPTDKTAVNDALGGQSLLSIYSVYEKLKGKSTASTAGPSSAAEGRPSTPAAPSTAAKDDAKFQPTSSGPISGEAETLKSQGNAAMAKKDYKTAIQFYTAAIGLAPTNSIYLSNRAAAYSASGDHSAAAQDAELATATDPKYTKAWSRLGLARFALGDAKGAMEAYAKGIENEGNGGSEAMKRGFETARKRVSEMEEEEEGLPTESVDDASGASRGAPGAGAGGMPDLSALAGMFGGGGGAGGRGAGGGGMPDLSSIMSNPMFANMAQNLMSNPDMMNNLMSNPRIRQMAESFGGGAGGSGGAGGAGGMPDLSSMMNDPNIAEMARNFMGGAGGAGGAGAGRGAGR